MVEQARMAMFAIQKQVLAGDLGAISQWRQLIETIGRLGGLMSPDVATFVGAAIEIHMHRLPDNDAPGDGEAPKELALAELEDRPAPLSAPDGEVAP